MSSLATSSPVSESTFRYLIRRPVARFSWLNEIFSDSEVARYSATGQVTRDSLRKPFQLARGAMRVVLQLTSAGFKTNDGLGFRSASREQQENWPAARSAPETSCIACFSSTSWRFLS